jgi:hypothetical protein
MARTYSNSNGEKCVRAMLCHDKGQYMIFKTCTIRKHDGEQTVIHMYIHNVTIIFIFLDKIVYFKICYNCFGQEDEYLFE